MIQKILWLFFALFSAAVVGWNWDKSLWEIQGSYSFGKYLFWLAFVTFTSYSYYCSQRESLFRSVAKIGQLHWGRQIGIDLYIGFFLFCGFIALHQGAVAMLIWLIPVLVYGNQVTLLYLAVHYESIVKKFAMLAGN
jgi:hypothetical protein